MAEFEVEATVAGIVKCPVCGKEFETALTDTIIVDIEPDDERGDPD